MFNSISSTSASETFTFTCNAFFMSPNSPLVGNVVVTDADPTTVNSVPSVSLYSIQGLSEEVTTLTIPANEVIVGTQSGNEIITATGQAGDNIQLWTCGGSLLNAGTTTATYNSNSLPVGYSCIYAKDTSTSVQTPNQELRRIIVDPITITLKNYQSTAVAASTPISFLFNPMNYTGDGIYNSLNDTVVYFTNGTVAYSYLEGPLGNEIAAPYTFNTYTKIVYWFKSPATNTFLVANG